MNYTTVSIKDARNNLSQIIEKVALVGDSFLVTKFGKPKALITSVDVVGDKKNTKLEILKRTAGLWADRHDIKSSASWVAAKRKKQSSRYGKVFS